MRHDASTTAVVIVNYRTKELTRDAALSVLSEEGVGEVVIVDNASADGSVDFLERELADGRVRVVASSENLGFGRGVNLGAGHCHAPLLLVLNSDARLVAGSLRPMVEALLESESVAVVAPVVLDAATGEPQAVAYGVFPTVKAILRRTNVHPPDTLSPDWVSGVAMLMRRRDFEAVGGFDPDFEMYLEDVDLCRRLRAQGKQIRRETAAQVVHAGGKSWTSTTAAFDQAQKSRLVYSRKAGFSVLHRVLLHAIRVLHLLRPGRLRVALRWRG